MKNIIKIVFAKNIIGPVKKFETKMKNSEANHKMVFVRRVIGPVKKFETKLTISEANNRIVLVKKVIHRSGCKF